MTRNNTSLSRLRKDTARPDLCLSNNFDIFSYQVHRTLLTDDPVRNTFTFPAEKKTTISPPIQIGNNIIFENKLHKSMIVICKLSQKVISRNLATGTYLSSGYEILIFMKFSRRVRCPTLKI